MSDRPVTHRQELRDSEGTLVGVLEVTDSAEPDPAAPLIQFEQAEDGRTYRVSIFYAPRWSDPGRR